MGTKRTGKMPNRGKLLAPIEKAPCPCWASTVPNYEPKQTKIPNRPFGLNVPMSDLGIKPKLYNPNSTNWAKKQTIP